LARRSTLATNRAAASSFPRLWLGVSLPCPPMAKVPQDLRSPSSQAARPGLLIWNA
jgi:hypothetical protein